MSNWCLTYTSFTNHDSLLNLVFLLMIFTVVAPFTSRRKVTQLQNELQKSQSTLDSAVSNSQTQQEQSVLHIEELETSVQKLTAELRETKDSLALASEVNNETSNALELTRKDAASAAAELMVACEENKRLERQCDDLKEDVERAESAQAEIEQRNSYLEGQMRHLEAENNALREELYQMHLSNHETNPLPALPTPTTQSRGSGSIVAPVTPGQDGPMDPEDLLAMEISLLRHQKAGLEDQVKSAQILTPMAASLHREAMGLRADNALLKERAEIAELEAHSARDELLRVKQQANELHSELAKVLKGLGLQQPHKTSEHAKEDGLNARLSPITTLHGVASYQNPTFVEDSAKLPLCKAQDDQQVDSPHSSGSSENALLTELRSALNSLNPTTN